MKVWSEVQRERSRHVPAPVPSSRESGVLRLKKELQVWTVNISTAKVPQIRQNTCLTCTFLCRFVLRHTGWTSALFCGFLSELWDGINAENPPTNPSQIRPTRPTPNVCLATLVRSWGRTLVLMRGYLISPEFKLSEINPGWSREGMHFAALNHWEGLRE